VLTAGVMHHPHISHHIRQGQRMQGRGNFGHAGTEVLPRHFFDDSSQLLGIGFVSRKDFMVDVVRTVQYYNRESGDVSIH